MIVWIGRSDYRGGVYFWDEVALSQYHNNNNNNNNINNNNNNNGNFIELFSFWDTIKQL